MGQDKFLSLLYHDIFEYPLKEKELEKWKIEVDLPASASLQAMQAGKTGDYYHLPGRVHLVLMRKTREKISGRKFSLACHAAKILSRIPTIQFIGITGSLAMRNSSQNSDIDFFIVTPKGTLWITRMLVKLCAGICTIPLRSLDKASSKDALCINLWLDEANLTIPQNIRNLYTAHEVLQVVPLVDKQKTFEKFLEANLWAFEYWPNARKFTKLHSYEVTEGDSLVTQSLSNSVTLLCKLLEPLAYRFQLWYMRKRRTRELIERGRAFFHPFDWGEVVMREFKKRVKKYMVYLHKTTPIQIIS